MNLTRKRWQETVEFIKKNKKNRRNEEIINDFHGSTGSAGHVVQKEWE